MQHGAGHRAKLPVLISLCRLAIRARRAESDRDADVAPELHASLQGNKCRKFHGLDNLHDAVGLSLLQGDVPIFAVELLGRLKRYAELRNVDQKLRGLLRVWRRFLRPQSAATVRRGLQRGRRKQRHNKYELCICRSHNLVPMGLCELTMRGQSLDRSRNPASITRRESIPFRFFVLHAIGDCARR